MEYSGFGEIMIMLAEFYVIKLVLTDLAEFSRFVEIRQYLANFGVFARIRPNGFILCTLLESEKYYQTGCGWDRV